MVVELVLVILGGIFVIGELLDWLRRRCASETDEESRRRLLREVRRHASDGR